MSAIFLLSAFIAPNNQLEDRLNILGQQFSHSFKIRFRNTYSTIENFKLLKLLQVN